MSIEETIMNMNPQSTVMEVRPVEEKKDAYSIRALNATDIFPMTKIIRKIGLKDFAKCFEPEELAEITNTFSNSESMEDMAEIMGLSVVLKIVDVILANIPVAGKEVFEFIGRLTGNTADEIAMLPLDVFTNLVVDVFQREEFVGFMKAVSRLFK